MPTGATAWFNIMAGSSCFIARRLEEDLKTQRALLGCTTPADTVKVQADYYNTAIEQYSAEVSRILGIVSGAMNGPQAPLKSMFARRYDDVPL